MIAIPSLKFFAMPAAEKDAMQRNYAETFSVPLERVGWREKRSRKNGHAFFLYLIPAKKRRNGEPPGVKNGVIVSADYWRWIDDQRFTRALEAEQTESANAEIARGYSHK